MRLRLPWSALTPLAPPRAARTARQDLERDSTSCRSCFCSMLSFARSMLRAFPRRKGRPAVNSLMAMVPLPSKSRRSKTFRTPQATTSIPSFSRSFCMRRCFSCSWNTGQVSSPEPSSSASSKKRFASCMKRLRLCCSWMSMFSSSSAVFVVASSTKIPVMMLRTQKTANAMYSMKAAPSQGEISMRGVHACSQLLPPEMLRKSV
mmetsp:Transcript_315/g.1061  ORF Transcript_315/g.1061 Transcript_315/m.1061 type:complete len:205 (-) Transcript_315:135-749(-)